MPTAAKLAAATLFGFLAWHVSGFVDPLFPEGTDLGRFAEYNAAIGAVIGWRVSGTRARTTWPNAVAHGITTALSMLIVALLFHSLARMLSQSIRRVYEGPLDALVDVVRIMIENFHMIATPGIMGTLLVGGVLAGLATEWVARNYK